ncbi:MAG: DUF502 domain-containing protein [Bacteroidota bacterium]
MTPRKQADHFPKTFWGILRGAFLRGLGLSIPVMVTIWVIQVLFQAVDGFISPIYDQVLGMHIPGLGFITVIVLLLIIGLLARNWVGSFVFSQFDKLILSVPFARTIYSATKDLIQAFNSGGKTFRRVLLVEYPRPRLYTIAFQTNEIEVTLKKTGERMISVYIPNPPNPTSGIMILVPEKDAHPLAISVEEGLKLVLSGGIVSPHHLSVLEWKRQ